MRFLGDFTLQDQLNDAKDRLANVMQQISVWQRTPGFEQFPAYQQLLHAREVLENLIERIYAAIAHGQIVPVPSSGEIIPIYDKTSEDLPPGETPPVQTSGNDSTASAIMWGSAALVLLALYGVSRPSRR